MYAQSTLVSSMGWYWCLLLSCCCAAFSLLLGFCSIVFLFLFSLSAGLILLLSISSLAFSSPANSRSSSSSVAIVKPNRVGSLHWRTKLAKKLSRALPFLSKRRKSCEYSFFIGSFQGFPLLFMPATTPRSPVWLSVTISTSFSDSCFSCSLSIVCLDFESCY